MDTSVELNLLPECGDLGNVRRLLISVRTRAEVSLPILLDLDKGSPKNCQWATKVVIIQELTDPSTDARTSEAVFPPRRDVTVGFNFFFFQATVPFSILWTGL